MKTKRNNIHYLFLLLLFLFQEIAVAQIDSLKNLPIDSLMVWLDKEMLNNDEIFPEVAHFALNKALKKNDYKSAALIHHYISFWNYMNYEINGFDTISYHRIKQIEYDEKIGNLEAVARGYVDLAIDYKDNNQIQKAQSTLLKTIKIFEELEDDMGRAYAHANLAYMYNDMGKYRKALEYSELSLPIFVKNKHIGFQVDVMLLGFSKAYFISKDYPNALKYVDECIRFCAEYEFEQKKDYLFEAYQQKGNIFLAKKDFVLAEAVFTKAWLFSVKHFDKETAEKNRFDIGNTLFLQGRYKKALPHLLASVQGLESLPQASSFYFKRLSECYEKLGQYKQALIFHIKAFDLEEKITTDKITSLESEALVKYESGKKDQQLLEQKEAIQQKNQVLWLSIGVAILLTILLSTLFYVFRKNQKNSALLRIKNNEIEERNQQNELLLKEIHHRVKNNLEIVSSLLALQSRQLDDQNAKSAMQESQNRVQSMGIIHQKLYQGENLAAIEMKDYFVNLGEGVLDSFGKSEQVKITCVMRELELDVDTAVPIGLIVNELLTNALKYAFVDEEQPEIKIQLERLPDDSLQLKVSDNGIGKSNNEVAKGTGFGSQLVQLLTAQLEGAMDYVVDQGSHFSFHFKLSTE